MLLKNATAILLQNATKVYYKMHLIFNCECGSYYKLRRLYYKMWQLLQNATFVTNCDSTSVMKHNSSVLFSSKTLYALDRRSPSKCKFSNFRLLAWKLTKFLVPFFKPQVNFPLNFTSPFSALFTFPVKFSSWNIYFGVHQSTIFWTFGCSHKSSLNSSCQFWNHKVRVYLNFGSLFSVMKYNSSVFI